MVALALTIGSTHVLAVAGAGFLLGCGFGFAWSLVTSGSSTLPEPTGHRRRGTPTTQLIGSAAGAALAGPSPTVGLATPSPRRTPPRRPCCSPPSFRWPRWSGRVPADRPAKL